MRVDIWHYDDKVGDWVVAGSFLWDGHKLSVEPAEWKGAAFFLQHPVLARSRDPNEKGQMCHYKSEDNPELWFNNLCFQWHGTYLSATKPYDETKGQAQGDQDS